MLYTLSEKIMPAYYRDYYHGDYAKVRRDTSYLTTNPITALHYHQCLELGICVSGNGVTYVDNRIYSYSEGDLQVVPAGVPHLSMGDKENRGRWCWISLEPMRIFRDNGLCDLDKLQELADKSYAGVFHPWEYPQLAELLYQFQNLTLDDSDQSRLSVLFLAGQLLLECARIGDIDGAAQPVTAASAKVMPAVRYIRTNYHDSDAMREEKIAAACGMSCSHLRAVFKRETGLTVRDFVIQTRLVAAAYLLRKTNRSVMDIAMESGFGQISCFNRSFSKIFGQTPTAFRKNSRNPANIAEPVERMQNGH